MHKLIQPRQPGRSQLHRLVRSNHALAGPKLLTNQGTAFKDDTATLPKEPYYNVTAAVWIDFDDDKRPDILLANGFLGLRLYRNTGAAFEDATIAAKLGPDGVGGNLKGDHFTVANVNGDGRSDFLYSAGTELLALSTPQGFVESKDAVPPFQPGKVRPAVRFLTFRRSRPKPIRCVRLRLVNRLLRTLPRWPLIRRSLTHSTASRWRLSCRFVPTTTRPLRLLTLAVPLAAPNAAPLVRLAIADPFEHLHAIRLATPPADSDAPDAAREVPSRPQLAAEAPKK